MAKFFKEIGDDCPICGKPLIIRDDKDTGYIRYNCEGDEDHDYALLNCTITFKDYIEEYRLGEFVVYNDCNVYADIHRNDRIIVKFIDGPVVVIFTEEKDLRQWLTDMSFIK